MEIIEHLFLIFCLLCLKYLEIFKRLNTKKRCLHFVFMKFGMLKKLCCNVSNNLEV